MSKLAGRFTQIFFAGYDLTGRSNQWEFNDEWVSDDVTAFGEGAVNSIPDLPQVQVNVTAFLDPATAQSHEALSTPGGYTDESICILIGQNQAVAIGDPALAVLCKQFTYNPAIATRRAVIANANFQSAGERPGYGVVQANATITNTTNFTEVDNLASSANGGAGYLQVATPALTDSYQVKLQHAATLPTYADLATFSANGQSRTSERQAINGTINRYTRAVATRTGAAGDNFKPVVVLARH